MCCKCNDDSQGILSWDRRKSFIVINAKLLSETFGIQSSFVLLNWAFKIYSSYKSIWLQRHLCELVSQLDSMFDFSQSCVSPPLQAAILYDQPFHHNCWAHKQHYYKTYNQHTLEVTWFVFAASLWPCCIAKVVEEAVKMTIQYYLENSHWFLHSTSPRSSR